MSLEITESETALEKKALSVISRYNMISQGDSVLSGLSGGADSSALLAFLCWLRDKMGITVYAAHINHELRGDEALRDENFSHELCVRYNVPFFVLHENVASIAAQSGETVEEAGRRVRYEFFAKTAARYNAKIATAHTLSDSMETFLFNFVRGTGLRGLCGIPPVRGRIIRPLIECERTDTEDYCKKCGIIYVNDSTNFSHEYSRNKIRLDVIPKLREINVSVGKSTLRLLNSLREDEECLLKMTDARLEAAKVADGVYNAEKLISGDCPNAVLKRCVAVAAQNFTGVSQEAVHICAIADNLRAGHGKIEIRGGCYACVSGGKLIFSRPLAKAVQTFCEPLCVKRYNNGKFIIEISLVPLEKLKNLKNINKQYFKNALDCDKIIRSAVLRSRLPGDKIKPAGRNLTKTLKKLFNEAHILPGDRDSVPVAADSKGVLWVYGFGPDERCKITMQTKHAFLFSVKNLEG